MKVQRSPVAVRNQTPSDDSENLITLQTPVLPTANHRRETLQNKLKRYRADNEGDSAEEEEQKNAMDKMMEVMLSRMEENQNEIRQLHSTQSNKIEELSDKLTSRLDATDLKVNELSETVTKTRSDVMDLQLKFDEIEQEKLATHMVISGIENSMIDSASNPQSLVRELLASYQIPIDDREIANAFSMKSSGDKRKIVVVFHSTVKKIEVMKRKRESSDRRKIFFDHRMTAKTSELYHKVRLHAKEKGGKAILYGGRVHYAVDGKAKMRIKAVEDLNNVESPATNPA
jgi:predicted nuclease with TOPRIM domain